MIYDVRIYDLKPGTVDEYMAAVRDVGLPGRESHGIKLAGWYYTEIGTLNQVIHIWGYQDIEDMETKMRAVSADPRWVTDYLPRVLPLLANQKNQVMHPSDFCPIPA